MSHTGFARRIAWVLLCLCVCLSGCLSPAKRVLWRPPELVAPIHQLRRSAASSPIQEQAYARARKLDRSGNAGCVDFYFQAAALTANSAHHAPCADACREQQVHRAALNQLIQRSQDFGRFDPSQGIHVCLSDGDHLIPVRYQGFPWNWFCADELVPVGCYQSKELNTKYGCDGAGVALVAIRNTRPNEPFHDEKQLFSVTAVLVPDTGCSCGFAIELVDSLRCDRIDVAGQQVRIRRDLSAPIAYSLKNADRIYLSSFLKPEPAAEAAKLFLTEPYQPGKIPVVFVHGLMSDRYTWATLVNEFRSCPDLVERYQILGFEYSTGAPFLASAAAMRQQLAQFYVTCQCAQHTPLPMVVVGHSMGGLVAKLQITDSGDQLWRSVARTPLDQVATSSDIRATLFDSFYFQATPGIGRVVYIGTPHRGAPLASRPVGSIGSALVDEPDESRAAHRQLINDNPGVFSPEFSRRIPTSIDLLRQDSCLLAAIDGLPVSPHACQHSIIGSSSSLCAAGQSDVVVPVSSAMHRGVESELFVDARHPGLHRSKTGIDEVIRILRRHVSDPSNAVPFEDWKTIGDSVH